ncbi:hypothetical protein [Natronobacterium gregoryi]|uniref:Uncharacterized protein n=2 Tax=Natronobacterium gregoryi TaxID=44930 RepID=L0AJY9_NATGS|nr:hypothetical protein [Natronobacterium gregoryi]AFZ74091.1 hypothetical protein Natgr_2955 [Natronobacterium gregoryi SP2]PLK18630.1 hypothetical protein CYV19_17580 [Natronobacterium gregoryi SP2]SFJ61879.1 hypothetical protein SAMN05443661_14712 [Natronobacterium gregoryi]
MLEINRLLAFGRNLLVYAAGVGLLVVGALGVAGAIDLSTIVAGPLFVAGLILVVGVHEYFGGPVSGLSL